MQVASVRGDPDDNSGTVLLAAVPSDSLSELSIMRTSVNVGRKTVLVCCQPRMKLHDERVSKFSIRRCCVLDAVVLPWSVAERSAFLVLPTATHARTTFDLVRPTEASLDVAYIGISSACDATVRCNAVSVPSLLTKYRCPHCRCRPLTAVCLSAARRRVP